MRYPLQVTAILFFALAQGPLFAVETVSSAASAASTPANEAGSARSIALGSTYVGIAEGTAALPWNPAGLATLCAPELAIDHDSTLVGSFQESAVLGLPLSHHDGLGLSLDYGNNGSIEGRDDSGHLVGDYSSSAFGATAGWGIRGPADLAFGAALKFNGLYLSNVPLYALAADLGALWSPTPSLRVGVSYLNLGQDLAGAHLEQGLDLGLSSYFWKGQAFECLTALSLEALTHGDTSVHAGVEGTFYQCLSLRAGYSSDLSDPQNSHGLLGWTLGAGVKLQQLSLDYAYVPMEEIGSIQRLSLTYAFGDCGPPAKHVRED